MIYIEIATLAIAVFTLAFSLYTYFTHSKKINELQIKKGEREQDEAEKADIRVSIGKNEQNLKILTITNCGKAIARNVVVKGLDQDRFCIVNNPNKFVADALRPQQSFEIHFTVNYGADSAKITMFWDDDFQKNNWAEQKVIIP